MNGINIIKTMFKDHVPSYFYMKHMPCVKHFTRDFIYFMSLNPQNTTTLRRGYCFYFIDEYGEYPER